MKNNGQKKATITTTITKNNNNKERNHWIFMSLRQGRCDVTSWRPAKSSMNLRMWRTILQVSWNRTKIEQSNDIKAPIDKRSSLQTRVFSQWAWRVLDHVENGICYQNHVVNTKSINYCKSVLKTYWKDTGFSKASNQLCKSIIIPQNSHLQNYWKDTGIT